MSRAGKLNRDSVRDHLGFSHPKSEIVKANRRRRMMLDRLVSKFGAESPLVKQMEDNIEFFESLLRHEESDI